MKGQSRRQMGIAEGKSMRKLILAILMVMPSCSNSSTTVHNNFQPDAKDAVSLSAADAPTATPDLLAKVSSTGGNAILSSTLGTGGEVGTGGRSGTGGQTDAGGSLATGGRAGTGGNIADASVNMDAGIELTDIATDTAVPPNMDASLPDFPNGVHNADTPALSDVHSQVSVDSMLYDVLGDLENDLIEPYDLPPSVPDSPDSSVLDAALPDGGGITVPPSALNGYGAIRTTCPQYECTDWRQVQSQAFCTDYAARYNPREMIWIEPCYSDFQHACNLPGNTQALCHVAADFSGTGQFVTIGLDLSGCKVSTSVVVENPGAILGDCIYYTCVSSC
jgi:hypothetical protein